MSEQEHRLQEQQLNGSEEHEQEPKLRPKIYVASLSDYNAGRLHGSGWTLPRSPRPCWPVSARCWRPHRNPIAEEWAIHDYEGFAGVRSAEYESIEKVSKIALGIVEHGPAFGAWAEYLGRDSWGDLDRFEDCYQGRFDSLTDYAEDFLDALGLRETIEKAVPEELQPYVNIDAEAFGRDMSYNGDIYVVEDDPAGGVFIFGP